MTFDIMNRRQESLINQLGLSIKNKESMNDKLRSSSSQKNGHSRDIDFLQIEEDDSEDSSDPEKKEKNIFLDKTNDL